MSYSETIILAWFEISPMEARKEAQDIETTISDLGGDASNPASIEKAIYRFLGGRYPWKNIEKKKEIEGNKKLTEETYNRYIQSRK